MQGYIKFIAIPLINNNLNYEIHPGRNLPGFK